jgi:hypothetical protein
MTEFLDEGLSRLKLEARKYYSPQSRNTALKPQSQTPSELSIFKSNGNLPVSEEEFQEYRDNLCNTILELIVKCEEFKPLQSQISALDIAKNFITRLEYLYPVNFKNCKISIIKIQFSKLEIYQYPNNEIEAGIRDLVFNQLKNNFSQRISFTECEIKLSISCEGKDTNDIYYKFTFL